MKRLDSRFLELLTRMRSLDASDLHLAVGAAPRFRVDGSLAGAGDSAALTPSDTTRFAASVLSSERHAEMMAGNAVDAGITLPNGSRFRVSAFRQQGQTALAIRSIPAAPHGFRELGLPSVLSTLVERSSGLVLVTGSSGSGKSTTLASMVHHLNTHRDGHIVTIEDPVEQVHRHNRCLVSQLEVGRDTADFASALRQTLRHDPDVIMVGEMRDTATIEAVLSVAETGHLALSTLHTRSAAESVNRVVNAFPSGQRDTVREQLATVLAGTVAQFLVPTASGKGRVPACEILIGTPAVRTLIREGCAHQLDSVIQTGRRSGMQTLNDSLLDLLKQEAVTLESCLQVTRDPTDLRRRIRRWFARRADPSP